MSEGLQSSISVLIGILGSSILMIVTYYFGPGGYLRKKNHLDDDKEGDS